MNSPTEDLFNKLSSQITLFPSKTLLKKEKELSLKTLTNYWLLIIASKIWILTIFKLKSTVILLNSGEQSQSILNTPGSPFNIYYYDCLRKDSKNNLPFFVTNSLRSSKFVLLFKQSWNTDIMIDKNMLFKLCTSYTLILSISIKIHFSSSSFKFNLCESTSWITSAHFFNKISNSSLFSFKASKVSSSSKIPEIGVYFILIEEFRLNGLRSSWVSLNVF